MRTPIRFLLLGFVLVAGCSGSGRSGPSAGPISTVGTAGRITDQVPISTGSLRELARRAAHTATSLPSGDVLVAGGCITDGCGTATAETFIVASDGTSVARGPDLASPRDGHTATALSDGSVVLIGGYAGEGLPPLASIEVYDYQSAGIRSLDELNQRRGGHASALIGGDRILVVGGWVARRTYTSSAEIVDASSGRVTDAAPLPLALQAMDATSLYDNRVLVTGGQVADGEGTNRAWLYDPVSDSWSETGRMSEPRFKHYSVLLPEGRVLVIGGTRDDREILASTEVYDPATGTFTSGPDLVEPRYKLPGGAVVLEGDRVIVAGGGRTIEVLDLATGSSSVVEDLGSQGSFATATALGDRLTLVLGGYDLTIDLRREVRLIPTS